MVVALLLCGFSSLLALIGGSVFARDGVVAGRSSEADVVAKAELRLKLDEVIVPEVDFTEATLSEAVDFCIAHSRGVDPDGRGVSR